MRLFEPLHAWLAGWLERAMPSDPAEARWQEQPLEQDELAPDERRQSIRDVTLEQLGIAHWSCHTHF